MREKGWYYIHIEFGRRTTVADDLKCVNVSKSDERSSKNRPTKECMLDELATCAGKQNNGRTNVCMVGPNSVCKI